MYNRILLDPGVPLTYPPPRTRYGDTMGCEDDDAFAHAHLSRLHKGENLPCDRPLSNRCHYTAEKITTDVPAYLKRVRML